MKQANPKLSEELQELCKQYGLDMADDFWLHPQSGKHILLHDAVMKIALQEGFTLTKIERHFHDGAQVCDVWGTLGYEGCREQHGDGEASPANCKSPVEKQYPSAMATKRAKDRLILTLLGQKAADEGKDPIILETKSDIESSDFARNIPAAAPTDDSQDQREFFFKEIKKIRSNNDHDGTWVENACDTLFGHRDVISLTAQELAQLAIALVRLDEQATKGTKKADKVIAKAKGDS